MKVDEVFKMWVEDKKLCVKPSTAINYEAIYYFHVRAAFGEREVEGISKRDAQNFLYTKLADGLSRRYVRDMLNVLRQLVDYAEEELGLDARAHWKLKWPTRNVDGEARPDSFTRDEFKRIVAMCHANPSPKTLCILLAICGGMRIGEVCGLKVKDIDLERKIVSVNRCVQFIYCPQAEGGGHCKMMVGSPKTASSRREVPIVPGVFSLAKKLCKGKDPDLYICSMGEKPTNPRWLRESYQRFIRNKCGIDRVVRFHGLRHTFATLMIESKVDVKTVSSILGHRNVSTTLNTYVHPSEQSKRQSMVSSISKLLK